MQKNQLTRFLLIERAKALALARELDRARGVRRKSVKAFLTNGYWGEVRAYDRILEAMQAAHDAA